MTLVTIELPTLLQRFADHRATIDVEGNTVRCALEAMFQIHPSLRVHLFDDAGALRQHVLCFHNGVNTRWGDSLEAKVNVGDRITIMQAVSGG